MNVQSAPQGNNIQVQGLQGGVAGRCSNCQNGVLTDSFTPCGIVLAICFFPLGLLCCWMMREKQCNMCGAKPAMQP
ncbi:Brain protein I3 [Amphibalanus amphitrite]|uniref:Brain protein I3 n=1 Tax=Amphibalanus amphitrite TaxID=1232801 RepID=A0A6A4VHF0_AMPAM|nr:brain protein I3-like [Amphibalanus amphitrite]XP_043198988.1 brain protein I3-like [Amphibalanus amphitrite]XP_043198989.1 brain protein I3-like [Amphibalanus amphitrite]KAF0292559.1 Brain protein I3 [Amphibalanus amphitrite]